MFKLNEKANAGSLLYSLSHFECDGHTVHMLTQGCLPPPLTSSVKSSLFTHTHPSPLSLAARPHQCHVNCSHYINNGWSFSEQSLYSNDSQKHIFGPEFNPDSYINLIELIFKVNVAKIKFIIFFPFLKTFPPIYAYPIYLNAQSRNQGHRLCWLPQQILILILF